MKICPTGSKVLVRLAEAGERMSPGGLVLPSTSKRMPQVGEVMEVGPGHYQNGVLVPVRVQVTQDVMIRVDYEPTELTIDGVPYLLLDEDEILAVVED